MSDGIKIDFAEIDRLSTAITSLNTFAGPLVPKIGALSADGDLLASAILSPGTAAAAEGAVLNASAQLAVTVVSTEALVLITVSFSKVYEAADAALTAAALAIDLAEMTARAAVHAMESVVGAKSFQQFLVRIVVLQHDARTIVKDVAGVLEDAVVQAIGGTQADVLTRLAKGENPVDVFKEIPLLLQTHGVEGLEKGLSGVPGGYQGLLDTIIRDGSWLGLFDDRPLDLTTEVPTLPDKLVNGQEVPDSVDERARDAARQSQRALGLDADELLKDPSGKILPRSLEALFAGSSQIDAIGDKDVSAIRVVTVRDAEGNPSFIVQIPSTLNWSPATGPIGNDLTSDVIALQQHQQTALANASWEALDKAMATAGAPSDAPVMLSGFSLGGITAGSMAANSQGHNVQQVVTAGAPIGRFDIPATTGVTAFEADGDPVARLDGLPNSRGTIADAPAILEGASEDQVLGPKEIHNANRYARMAQQAEVGQNERFSSFFSGAQEATDYYGVRK